LPTSVLMPWGVFKVESEAWMAIVDVQRRDLNATSLQQRRDARRCQTGKGGASSVTLAWFTPPAPIVRQ
jgi:hypothetical protein